MAHVDRKLKSGVNKTVETDGARREREQEQRERKADVDDRAKMQNPKGGCAVKA